MTLRHHSPTDVNCLSQTRCHFFSQCSAECQTWPDNIFTMWLPFLAGAWEFIGSFQPFRCLLKATSFWHGRPESRFFTLANFAYMVPTSNSYNIELTINSSMAFSRQKTQWGIVLACKHSHTVYKHNTQFTKLVDMSSPYLMHFYVLFTGHICIALACHFNTNILGCCITT